MAAHSTSKLIPLRRTLARALKPLSAPSPCSISTQASLIFPQTHATGSFLDSSSLSLPKFSHGSIGYRHYSSAIEGSLGAAAIDYPSAMHEDEYHKLANSTIHDLLEKLEEYGDSVEIDGYDVDYGNEVLTLKLGSLGTYVINKQTPNRQIWMSSPVSSLSPVFLPKSYNKLDKTVLEDEMVIEPRLLLVEYMYYVSLFLDHHIVYDYVAYSFSSGPSRFDWDQHSRAWIYRRTRQDLIKVLETELPQLCGHPIHLT
ncbi:frataxin, mitochondrial [Dorcoceras hygrometricum]|nr:frataxin, mitochondrial [Dorcoceras hygrometricum]